ncbi:39S ribosomal protein L12, mitochondrial [Eufriesea mexicana]|uniref:39S ribosomal protein L12, mitochondrial n=2 Tax=Eufriesea mexicana TaxID=516756 RepID=A0A310SM77_9HYME|nr:39S ribosomal protein L12, mitochondrial [Eufriesea mexicana]
MNTFRFVCQRNIHQIRHFHKCIIRQNSAAAVSTATDSLSESVSTKDELKVSSKVELIANQIVTLNLIEVRQLSDLLKKQLNLPDAPIMSMGTVNAPKPEEDEEEQPQIVQTLFNVKLTGFDEKQKIALIKELKNILPNCNLVQAKKFVDSVPNTIKEDVVKDEAEKLKEVITKVGGVVEIV